MKHVVNVTFTSTKNNFETVVDFGGRSIRVSQFGADFDRALMGSLLRRFDGKCDVIAVSGFHPPIAIGKRAYQHPDSARLLAIPTQTPVVNGFLFRNTYVPWAVRNQANEHRGLFQHQRIAFLSGLLQQHLAGVLAEYTGRILFADPYFHLGVPLILKGNEALATYARRMMPILRRITLKKRDHGLDFDPWLKTREFREFLDADIFVSTATMLERFDLGYLKGKTVMVDALPRALERDLHKACVKDVIYFTPECEATRQEPRLSYAALEALIQCTKADATPVTQDDILSVIMELKLRPTLRSVTQREFRASRKFAFIIHPLSGKDFFRHPVLKPLRRALPSAAQGALEAGLSHLPGAPYGKITGVKSAATGETTEGLIYTLFDTPRQLLAQDPERVYDKLVKIAEHASDQGADIIGLGAFTKVVGDAGVTVASRSPIPVTTGNSLSAAATLWAARVAVAKLGFLPPYSYGARLKGTAMVVGATGSIGAVSAKLLAKVAARIIISGPRADKLLELKEEIERDAPDTEVLVATSPNKFAAQSDLIVLSTSALDANVLDILQVKPGCVICDVSRPLSIRPEDVVKRPDVLVIESGEVELPGTVDISCDIGLDESVVYACLAETALLALEGRMESFTLSRTISYDKVKEIYDLARKHGARLATIRGPLGIITDQEIALCREHALARLARAAETEEKATAPAARPPRERKADVEKLLH